MERELQTLEQQANAPDFWNDHHRARQVMAKMARLRKELEFLQRLEKDLRDLTELEELAEEDPSLGEEYQREFQRLARELEDLEFRLIFSEEDARNAILTIHPGAGGTESMDWAEMLLRMYLKWLEKAGFKYKVIYLQPGEEAGIKDATVLVEGPYAYGYLKGERGVHRLVRISPFDASRRRHTSFASVFVYPETEEIEVEINENDLKIDTFRASGPGGQHMQKNETAVRITHIPTGIVVTCQSERSQHQNKETALKILRARLYAYYQEKEREKLKEIEKEKGEIAWGRQIRSYVLHPYKMVKDHRTGYEVGNADAVLDGDLDGFIRAYLRLQLKEKLQSTQKAGGG